MVTSSSMMTARIIQLSDFSYQTSAIRLQLSAISSDFSFQLPASSFQLPAVDCRLSAVSSDSSFGCTPAPLHCGTLGTLGTLALSRFRLKAEATTQLQLQLHAGTLARLAPWHSGTFPFRAR